MANLDQKIRTRTEQFQNNEPQELDYSSYLEKGSIRPRIIIEWQGPEKFTLSPKEDSNLEKKILINGKTQNFWRKEEFSNNRNTEENKHAVDNIILVFLLFLSNRYYCTLQCIITRRKASKYKTKIN